jgi:hypothetical protein
VPWVPLDIHWTRTPEMQEAAEEGGPLVFAIYPTLLGWAKSQMDGGRVGFTWRDLCHEIWADRKDVETSITSMLSAGVLSCRESTDRGAVLAFDSSWWKRNIDKGRKAEKREEAQTA